LFFGRGPLLGLLNNGLLQLLLVRRLLHPSRASGSRLTLLVVPRSFLFRIRQFLANCLLNAFLDGDLRSLFRSFSFGGCWHSYKFLREWGSALSKKVQIKKWSIKFKNF